MDWINDKGKRSDEMQAKNGESSRSTGRIRGPTR